MGRRQFPIGATESRHPCSTEPALPPRALFELLIFFEISNHSDFIFIPLADLIFCGLQDQILNPFIYFLPQPRYPEFALYSRTSLIHREIRSACPEPTEPSHQSESVRHVKLYFVDSEKAAPTPPRPFSSTRSRVL
jgi:hypothetical protein